MGEAILREARAKAAAEIEELQGTIAEASQWPRRVQSRSDGIKLAGRPV